jgi:hypothetical protein
LLWKSISKLILHTTKKKKEKKTLENNIKCFHKQIKEVIEM